MDSAEQVMPFAYAINAIGWGIALRLLFPNLWPPWR